MTEKTDSAVRIAMWSGPRNISTAMMRSFENRLDTVVIDEPFYACYLKATGLDHPGRDLVLKEQPTSWQAVVTDLMAPLPKGKSTFYQKHMCHHMLPDIGLEWTERMRHAFLIRDPRLMIKSYIKTRDQVSLQDLGLERQLALFQSVSDRQGKAAPVIDSADVVRAPKESLTKLCGALDIPFDPRMLSWPKGPRESDGVWAPWWYAGVEQSTGFKGPGEDQNTDLAGYSNEVQAVERAAMPIYDQLRRYKI